MLCPQKIALKKLIDPSKSYLFYLCTSKRKLIFNLLSITCSCFSETHEIKEICFDFY